jgi:hypothetical protein
VHTFLGLLRQPNTTTTSRPFDQAMVNAVWEKGRIVSGYDARRYRKDACGAWITREAYGTLGDYGWEIDHIIPVAKGGSDAFINLQPLHWQNNRHKGDNYPNWTCALSARV